MVEEISNSLLKEDIWGLNGSVVKHTVSAEDLSSSPRTHVRQFTATSNSNSRGSESLFWPPLTPTFTSTYPHRDTYTHTVKNEINLGGWTLGS